MEKTLTPGPSPRTGEGSNSADEYPDIDLATRNMLSMIEIVVFAMGEAAKKAIEYPHLAKPFMRDMIEFNLKMDEYKSKEVINERQD